MPGNLRCLRWLGIALAIVGIPVVSTAAVWGGHLNRPPSISGTPATSVVAGTAYRFTPTANDPEGRPLTFRISNPPTWATFNTTSGQLQGTPQSANVGSFSNIVISVSDGRRSASLAPFTITVTAAATTNRAPTISGAPATSVVEGTPYSFQPTAKDPDGNALTFSIVNKPAWAAFSSTTGRLQGTPGASDVGTTRGIVISVTDGKASAGLAAFDLAVQATATGSATLSWQPPTRNSDGSALTDLTGYKVYWGTTQGTYPSSATLNNPGLATYVVTNLAPGTYFFVTTAVNTGGIESQQSNVASKTIR